jgi:hypothetical protein
VYKYINKYNITNWKERSKNRADSEKFIEEMEVSIFIVVPSKEEEEKKKKIFSTAFRKILKYEI